MKLQLVAVMVFLGTLPVVAQFNLGGIKDKMEEAVAVTTSTSLTQDEIAGGLKEALTIGAQKAGDLASVADGFNGNQLIRIPFPHEAQKMKNTLIKVGFNKQVEDFEIALNRAAESASKKAAPIFIEAIKKMTVADGMNILKGDSTAATEYMKKATSDSLYSAFYPIVKMALEEVKITQYWEPLATRYNKVPFTQPVNPDLQDYTTQRAIKGLFVLVAQEERKIRSSDAFRVSDLLKKVFGQQ